MAPRAWRPERFALLGILALAASLRFVQLGHDSLWADEAFSAHIAGANVSDLFDQATSADPNPPLYWVLLHGWIAVFGDSEAALRSLSAVVGVALVLVVFVLGKRLGGSGVGLIAALLTAVSEFLVHYSQEARVYSLLALLAAGSYLFFLELLDEPRTLTIVGYVTTTTALLYAHTYGLFVVAGQIAFVLVALAVRREWIRADDLRRLGLALLLPFLLLAPWLVVFAGNVRAELEGSDEAKLSWLGAPPLRDLPGTFSGYAGSPWALTAALLALAACAYAALRRGKDARKLAGAVLDDRSVVLLVLWVAVTICVPFVISVAVTPIYQFKYTIPAAVACYLLFALAVGSLGTLGRGVAAVAVGVVFLSVTARYYEDYQTEDWRSATAYVARRAAPGDLVVFDSSVGKTAFDYYWRRTDVQEMVGSRFAALEETDLAAIGSAARSSDGIWLVVSHSRDPEGRIPVLLGQSHRLGARADFVSIRVDHFR
jgi:mannosyltransferase